MTISNVAQPRMFASGYLAPCLLLAMVIVTIPFLDSSSYILRVCTLVWVMALASVGVHIIMGLAGQISLGQAGFFAIGAYACAVLPSRFGVPPLTAAAIGCLVSMGVAYTVGRPILKLKGHYLAIATLGLSLLIGLVITNEVSFTGGPDGIDVQRLTIEGAALSKPGYWYWISGTLLWLGTVFALNLRNSPTGRAFRAILDSETAAEMMGIDTARRKLQAFVLAAMYGSIAGSTLALMNGFITPDIASLFTSIEFVAMVVIGGASSAFGAILGAALLTFLPQLTAGFHNYQDVVLGVVIVATMIYLPGGIAPQLMKLTGPFQREQLR
jgi:branched-chain amino acid transport system permease protein